MSDDRETAAETFRELTSTVGATAASLQNSEQTIRSLRRIAQITARRPDLVAALGVGLLVLSGVLALRGPEPPSDA